MSWRDWIGRLFGSANGNGGPGDRPHDLPCEEAVARLFEYLDDELDDVSHEEVERHLEICARCYPRLVFERSFLDTLDRVKRGEGAPPELRNRVLALIEESANGEG